MASADEALKLREGRKLVFTNGVFDILHAGHVDYLEAARAMGDLLIVGMNTDASVRQLGKGPERPINPLKARMRVLGALRCVDMVVPFEETTPTTLIQLLKPEIHVKGGDYDPESMPEAEAIRAYGGSIVIVPLVPGFSTTSILSKI